MSLYWGIKNKGSFCNNKKLRLINKTPIISLQKSLFIIEFGIFFSKEKLDKIIDNIKKMI